MNNNMNCITIHDLLDLSIFKCEYCKKRCQYPVMVVDKTRNCCIACQSQVQHVPLEANAEVNMILEKFSIPCRYVDDGCAVIDTIENVTKHEIICDYRDKICPLNFFNICDNRCLSNIPDHFKKEHPQCVISSESNSVVLQFNIKDYINIDEIYVLDIDHEFFLLHAKFDEDKNELLYALYCCGDQDDMKNYHCTIQQQSNKIQTMNVDFELLHESEFTIPINRAYAARYDLSVLKKCFDEIDTTVSVRRKHAYAQVRNNDLLNTLKCITCKAYLRDDICQCAKGHSACKDCIIETKKCTACNADYNGTRNFTLETLCGFLKYPCTNRGCSIYLSAKNIGRHESDCVFKVFGCPFREILHCQVNQVHRDMIEHIQTVHEGKYSLSNYTERRITLDNIDNEIYCLITFNNVFRFHIEKNDNIYTFSCKYIGKKSLARSYTFEICLIDSGKPDSKLLLKNSWKRSCDDEIWVDIHYFNFKCFIKTPNEILLSYRIIKYHEA